MWNSNGGDGDDDDDDVEVSSEQMAKIQNFRTFFIFRFFFITFFSFSIFFFFSSQLLLLFAVQSTLMLRRIFTHAAVYRIDVKALRPIYVWMYVCLFVCLSVCLFILYVLEATFIAAQSFCLPFKGFCWCIGQFHWNFFLLLLLHFFLRMQHQANISTFCASLVIKCTFVCTYELR